MTRDRNERGSITVLVAAVLVIAMLLCTGLARLGNGVREKARANNAADAAALAAADGMVLGDTTAQACARGRQTAADNGARLLMCDNRNSGMQVLVEFEGARAEARAEFDAPERFEVHGSPNPVNLRAFGVSSSRANVHNSSQGPRW